LTCGGWLTPFNIAAENALIKLWRVPDEGIKSRGSNLTESEAVLRGHNHKIVTVDFHPYAQHLLTTTSGDLTAKLWDIEAQKDVITLKVSLFFTSQLLVLAKPFSLRDLATWCKALHGVMMDHYLVLLARIR